jgi:DNA primase
MSDPIVQEIKSRLDVATVISSYIPVKKAGANFKAACPFHNEKTPSLSISPARGVWHCFGCGKGCDSVFHWTRDGRVLICPRFTGDVEEWGINH